MQSQVAEVMASGGFEFDEPVPLDDYQLQVIDPRGNVVYSGFASITDANSFLTIRIPAQRTERPPSGTVSIQDLERKISPKALKESERARKASQKGDTASAISHLEKAVQLDANFWQAHNNLGILYLGASQPDKALGQFQEAFKLEPDSATVNSNLAAVLIGLKRYPEAEKAARRSLRFDPSRDKAHYILGLSLEEQNRNADEALHNLTMVEPEFPAAHVAVAQILLRRGEKTQAANELKEYLYSGHAVHRRTIEAWIARLQQ